MLGTFAGALVGGAAAALRPQTPEGLGAALAVATAVTALLAVLRPQLKVAPVTAAIMLLSATGGLGPLHAAVYRVAEIGLGSLIAVAATLLIWPARSRTVTNRRLAQAADRLAAVLEAASRQLAGEAVELGPLNIAARQAIGEVEAALLRACGSAAVSGERVLRGEVAAARSGFAPAMEALRRERLTGDLAFEAAGRLFALAFGLESLGENVADLADRLDEAAGKQAAGKQAAAAPS